MAQSKINELEFFLGGRREISFPALLLVVKGSHTSFFLKKENSFSFCSILEHSFSLTIWGCHKMQT